MATIREVAEKAGVSAATVSYVLNDVRKVRPETEQRVRWAAHELGYSRNTAARSLALGRSSTIGLILPDICNPFFPEISKAFQEAAGAACFETIVMDTNSDVRRIHLLLERLMALQVPGAAFLTSQITPGMKETLAARNVAAVYLDHERGSRRSTNIAIDYRYGIREAVNHLVELGHRRVGFVGGPAQGSAARLRKQAFFDEAEELGLEHAVIDSDFTVQGGYVACSRLLSGFDATAVVAANDLMAIGAMHSASDRQLRVPADLSIVGFDDITFAQFTHPPLTSVAVPRADIGHMAFEALWGLINDPVSAGETLPVKPGLVVRQSTARNRTP
jgi:LacI family transcriptional regulator